MLSVGFSPMHRSIRRVAVVAALLLATATAWAGEPETFIKDKQGELSQLLKKPKGAAVDTKIASVFDQMLDYEALARHSLGDHWDELSEAQRTEFRDILKQLVRNAYRKNLRKTLDYAIEYRGEEKAKQGVLVRTIARHRANAREEPVSIDYLLHKVDGRWRVHDIVTEGSSLAGNYKSQFRRVIKSKGFAELMRRMKKKLEKSEA